jgi:hypothetical protein
MSAERGVGGKMGDVSGFGVGGKMGDVSGLGVGGKMGDVSGLPVGGKIGDVSGGATFEQVQELVLRDRNLGSIECLEAKVNRLEYDILSIARWLDLRIRRLEQNGGTGNVEQLEGKINELGTLVGKLQERIEALESGTPRRPPA